MYRILFITTNDIWGGSEELWTRSAKMFINEGFEIFYASPYKHPDQITFRWKHINLFSNKLYLKFLRKLRVIKSPFATSLKNALLKLSPKLVIISQGCNIAIYELMEACTQIGIPYVTITQLVAEIHYLDINNSNLFKLQEAYLNAIKNFFVSNRNINLNNRMLGMSINNTDLVFNPCKLAGLTIPSFPVYNDHFKVAIVGRLECYHKGLDLLLEIVSQKKWRERSIEFNLYGNGPHKKNLEINVSLLKLDKVKLKGYIKDVLDIWNTNQILFMPSRIEGQSLSLIEAMWCNRPVIVSDVGGASEFVQEGFNGFIAEYPTVKDLDETLERAWLQRYNWNQMGLNASKSIKSILPNNPVEYFNDKIKEIIE